MMRSLTAALVVALMVAASAAQQPATPEQPRFRGGANLVRVDTYVTADGEPVKDLTINDFEVLEDNVPQQVESFQLVLPRGPAAGGDVREPNTVAESREMARDPDARVFVLFMDTWHVQIDGSYRAQAPLTRLLDRVIGQDDLVGVMHPDMAARNITLARRMQTLAGILKDHWYWGERGKVVSSDPREQQIRQCYPDANATMGIAHEMIRRRRESKTLDALEDVIVHLESVREERKFVFVLTEGWLLTGPDQSLARALGNPQDGGRVPPPPGIGIDPQGRFRMDPREQSGDIGSCERERSLLAYTDHRSQFEQLVQRANRANVSFYPIDARGLVVFDEPINSTRALTVFGPGASPSADMARLRDRHDALKVLAANTDGQAIVDTNNIDRDLQRVVQDTGAYYLLGYYSSNPKLDGRYRRLTVRVKRPGVQVRSRPGYLAPTEADMASSRVNALMNGAPPGHTTIPPSLVRAFAGLPATRGVAPLRVQATAGPQQLWLTGELDATVTKAAEWQQGGRVRATLEHDRGASTRIQHEVALPAGQRVFQMTAPPGATLAPGRYVARVEVTPEGSNSPVQIMADVIVPEPDWLISPTPLAARRGPSTGLQYVPTADPRYRRTERIRLEVPRASAAGTATARVLGRDGQPLGLSVSLSDRTDADSGQLMLVADLTLAPLAQGEYAVELTIAQGDRAESATYAFRIVP